MSENILTATGDEYKRLRLGGLVATIGNVSDPRNEGAFVRALFEALNSFGVPVAEPGEAIDFAGTAQNVVDQMRALYPFAQTAGHADKARAPEFWGQDLETALRAAGWSVEDWHAEHPDRGRLRIWPGGALWNVTNYDGYRGRKPSKPYRDEWGHLRDENGHRITEGVESH